MAFIEWNSTLSVDVNQFDEQHKKLISLINELLSAMSKGEGARMINEVLKGLIEYTITHFSAEEEAMKKYQYPGLGLHHIEHKNLTTKVIELQNKLDKGEAVLSMEVFQFLKDWLVNHIIKTDKSYGVFFKSKG